MRRPTPPAALTADPNASTPVSTAPRSRVNTVYSPTRDDADGRVISIVAVTFVPDRFAVRISAESDKRARPEVASGLLHYGYMTQ